jgi:outer membrane protein assembly complex protein YaeT
MRKLLVVSTIICILAGTSVTFLHLSPVRRYVLNLGREYLNRHLQIDLEATELDYNLLRLTFSLSNLSLHSTQSLEAPPILSASRAFINLPLAALLRREFLIEEAVLEDARIHIFVDERGGSNIPAGEREKRDEPASIPAILIKSFKATGSHLVYEDRRHVTVRFHKWQLSVDGVPATLEHTVRFKVLEPGEIIFRSRQLPIDVPGVRLQWKKDEIQVAESLLSLGKSQFAISGIAKNLLEPVLDLGLEAGLQVNELARFTADRKDLTGEVRLQARLEGPLQTPNFTAQVDANDAGIGDIKDIIIKTGISWDSNAGMLTANPLAIRSPLGSVVGNASIAAGAGSSSIHATFNNVDLTKISQLLQLEMQIGSAASGSIDAAWPGTDWKTAGGRADIRLDAKGKSSKGKIPARGRIAVSRQSGRYQALLRDLGVPGTIANGSLSLDPDKKIGGELKIEADDLAGTVTLANLVLGRDPLETPISGEVRLLTTLSGTLGDPRLTGDIRGDSLSFGDIRDISFAAKAGYKQRKFLIEQATLGWQGQSVWANGEIGLGDDNPELRLDLQGQRIELSPVLGAVWKDLPLEGLVDFAATVTGTTDRPSAELDLVGSELEAYGESWGRLEVQAAFRDGRMEVKNLYLDRDSVRGNSGFLTGTGIYLPGAREYSFNAKADFSLQNLTLPGGRSFKGHFQAGLEGSGTTSNPSAAVTADITDFMVDSQYLGDLNIQARLAESLVHAEIDASRFGTSAVVESAMRFPHTGSFSVKTHIPDLSVLSFRGPDDAIIGGSFSGDLQGEGEFSNWKSMDAGLRIENASLIFNRQVFNTLTPVSVNLRNGVMYVDPTRILAGRVYLSLSGSLPVKSTESSSDELIVDMEGSLESLLGYFPNIKNVSARGNIQAHAFIRGGFDLPEPSIAITLTDGQIALPHMPEEFHNVELNAVTRNQDIFIDRFQAQWGAAILEANAHAPISFFSESLRSEPSAAAEFKVTLRDLDPGFVPGVPRGIGGNINLKVEGQASRFELSAITAQADFETLQLNIAEFNLEQRKPGRISLRDGFVIVDSLDIAGSGIDLALSGSARLNEMQDLDIEVAGKGDVGLFTSLFEEFRASGPSEFLVSVTGTIPNPQLTGSLTLRDGKIVTQTLPVNGEDIELSMRFTPGLIEMVEGAGALNGGRFSAMGSVAYDKGSIKNVHLSLDADHLDINFPKGLRTLSDSRIQIRQQDEQILVEGNITITDGSYREDLDLAGFFRSGGMQFVEDRNPFLSRVRFNVKVETVNPIVMDNRQARLMADSELTLVGTFYRPSLTGRLTLEEGGEVMLAEHRYILDTGIIDFVNESRIEPSLNLLARTQAAGYDINLRIQGSPGRMETGFTSDPPLPEPDIISLLLTGRTLEEARGSSLNIARQHAISYLTGQLGGRLSRSAEKTLGLSRVRIEPNLVSGDSDPGARLTVGQDLRRDLRLVYSMNLVDSSDQILIGEYDMARRFTVRGTNQFDNSKRIDFQHDLRLGGTRTGAGRQRSDTVFGGIELKGERVFPDEVLLDKLDIKIEQAYDFFRIREGIDRLLKFYRDNNYSEARVRLRQEKKFDSVYATFDINAGPSVEFLYEGFNLPGSFRKQIRHIWESGVFDAQRTSDTINAILRWFIQKHYFEADVLCTIRTSGIGSREVFIAMHPGTRYQKLSYEFEGAVEIKPNSLEKAIRKEAEGMVDSILNPARIADFLTQYYRQHGYSAVQVDPPRLRLNPETSSVSIEFRILEGPLFHIGHITYDGNRALSATDLNEVVTMVAGATFQPSAVRNSLEKMEELYWSHGFNDIRIDSQTGRDIQRNEVNILFQIDEQRQGIIGQIDVADNREVDETFIRSHLHLKVGDILDNRKTELSRRALYKTGAFELVELETDPLTPTVSGSEKSQLPLLLRARVREVVPYKIRYGGFYDTDRGPGAIFDFENRNSLLGGARLLGGRVRYDSDLQEIRGYFGQPLYFKFPSVASATVFARREWRDVSTAERIGLSLQHEMELLENMIFSYGYRFENVHTSMKETEESAPFDIAQRIAPLTASFSWSTRDELLDATRGFFLSNALEYAPSSLGSDLHYIKYFGQIFKYVPLLRPTLVPFGRGVKRPRLLYAGGVRIGFAGGFSGQAFPESERFFAGGGTSIRGYDQDAVGPENELGDPVGGEAVFVLNNELRFPIMSIFEGVGFLDVGNVYPKASNFNPTDVRSSAGPGIRIRTPYFLLRFDYGFKLDRKSDEGLGAFYFSIGQAF